MEDLILMTPEELQKHIAECQAILEAKRNEKVYQLVGNLASEAYKLLQERPGAQLKAEYYDEIIEENIEVYIDLDYLTYEDNYMV